MGVADPAERSGLRFGMPGGQGGFGEAARCKRVQPAARGLEAARGIDLVVQRAGRRPPQVVRGSGACWTPRSEERFLGKVRQCNNLRLACQRAGMTVSSFEAHCVHRRSDPPRAEA